MRNIVYVLLFALLPFAGCETPEKFESIGNSVLQDIGIRVPGTSTMSKPNEKAPYDNVSVLNIEVEGSADTDLSKVNVVASIPNNAVVEPSLSGFKDLTKPFDFKVIGQDGTEHHYTVNAVLVPTDVSIMLRYEKTGTELGFQQHMNNGVAISGEFFITHARSKFSYFNLADGSYAGDMSWDGADLSPFPLNITSDDAGNIVSCNFAATAGTDVRMYKWAGVNAQPELLFKWTSDVAGQVGRKMYVKGDLDNLAYIYLPVADKSMYLLWEVIDGVLTSQTPEKIEVNHPGNWGTQGKVVPIDLGRNSDFFTVSGDSERVILIDGETGDPLYYSEKINILGSNHGFDFININGAKFIFQIGQNAWNWMTQIFSVRGLIKNPESITGINDIVHTREWGSWVPVDPNLGSNANITGDVKAKVAEDGQSAVVVMLGTNCGVKVYDVNLEL